MNLRSLTLPNDPTEWASWLNELFASEDLLRTIAELKVIMKGHTESPKQLAEIVSDSDFDELCANGYEALEPEQCRKLIAQPELLLEIEERIIDAQPKYWMDKMSVASAPSFEEFRKRLPDFPEKVSLASKEQPSEATTMRRSWLTWGAIAAVAASALLAMWLRNPTAPTPWGFNKTGALAINLPEAEMLEYLEGLADEWYNKTPDSKEALVKRLNQYQNQCQTLLDTSLPQLSEASRVFVMDACRKCKKEIADHLRSLEDGGNFSEIQIAANASIDELKRAIRAAG